MTERHIAPSREEIAALEPFERLPLERIELISSAARAHRLLEAVASTTVLGFDTESRPTFRKGEVSDGPHIIQLATLERAWIIQLHERDCRELAADLLARDDLIKAGFGLGNDRQQLRSRLGAEPRGVIDLNAVFRQRGWRKDMGVKASVAVLFQRRFLKSGKAGTSNWALPRLSESQLLYAANDAWAAIRVWQALGLQAHDFHASGM